MNRLVVILMISILAFAGCTPEEAPAEPTHDSQEKVQTVIDMGQWMIHARYIQTLCEKTVTVVNAAVEERTGEDAHDAAKHVIDHINQPDGLIMRIKTRQTSLESVKQRIEKIADRDVRIFSCLVKMNQLNESFIELLSETPDIHDTFVKSAGNLKKQLDSLYSTLKVEYPDADDDLASLMAEDNLDYVADMKAIDNIPTPVPPATPTPELNLPTATPTLPPAQTWIDANGVMHMGHHPPENANIQEVKTKLSGGIGISEPPAEDSEETTEAETAKSVIWVDENGVTHMSGSAPEGVETKNADEIKLMVE